MPFDLDDTEDKLPVTTTSTDADDVIDDVDCGGQRSSKRQRLDITVPECYDSPEEEDTVNKVSCLLDMRSYLVCRVK